MAQAVVLANCGPSTKGRKSPDAGGFGRVIEMKWFGTTLATLIAAASFAAMGDELSPAKESPSDSISAQSVVVTRQALKPEVWSQSLGKPVTPLAEKAPKVCSRAETVANLALMLACTQPNASCFYGTKSRDSDACVLAKGRLW
jgi:hypothetical protein